MSKVKLLQNSITVERNNRGSWSIANRQKYSDIELDIMLQEVDAVSDAIKRAKKSNAVDREKRLNEKVAQSRRNA